jgi:outer membrane protein OmpA-like peptidoglycan-associated protein
MFGQRHYDPEVPQVIEGCSPRVTDYPETPPHYIYEDPNIPILRQVDHVETGFSRFTFTFRPNQVRIAQKQLLKFTLYPYGRELGNVNDLSLVRHSGVPSERGAVLNWDQSRFASVKQSGTWYAVFNSAGEYLQPLEEGQLQDGANVNALRNPLTNFSYHGNQAIPGAGNPIPGRVRKLTPGLELDTSGIEPGIYWVTLQGEADFGSEKCRKTTPPVVIEITYNELSVTITPPHTDLVPAYTGRSTFTAHAVGGDGTYSFAWMADAAFGNVPGNRPELLADTSSMEPGKDYPVNVEVTSGGLKAKNPVPSYLHVNNPPTVEITSPGRIIASSVQEGEEIAIVAEARDIDNDSGRAAEVEGKDQVLTYSWSLQELDIEGSPVDRTNMYNVDSVTGNTLRLKTGKEAGELPAGKYNAVVVARDGKNRSEWKEFPFIVIRKRRNITFQFDYDHLVRDAVEDGFKDNDEFDRLDEEVKWLEENKNNKLFVRVEGYADRAGQPGYNDCLGCRRARYIKRYLEKRGLPEHQYIVLVSFGEDKSPVSENAPRPERRPDRKVIVRYYREDGLNRSEILRTDIESGSPVPEGREVKDCSVYCVEPKPVRKIGKKKTGKSKKRK